ncbi:MAG: shikimate dehydrogenase family protein, partial [Dehalococcoidia bacterium]
KEASRYSGLVEVDPWARAGGAVNTIVNQQGRLLGYNTDSEGFLRALREDGGLEPRGVRVLLLGAGGAARGVALALAAEGVASMTIANRTASRAEALAEQVRSRLPSVEAVNWTGPDMTRATQNADLIVNCTSLGMRHGPGEGTSPLSASQIPSGCLVYDLVYNPSKTPLLWEARRAGARTLGGLPMLVYQGAASFRLWTGREAPVGVMMQAALRAMSSS